MSRVFLCVYITSSQSKYVIELVLTCFRIKKIDELDFLTNTTELNEDQRRVILALHNPEEFFKGHHSVAGIRGVPYKKIIEKTEMTLEKVLLSLGWLEAKGVIAHDVAIVRKALDYLGQTNIEIAGQSVVRMFYLTQKGHKILDELLKEEQ